MQLKEGAEGPEIGQRIRSLLTPREYTRLDEMVDVMFITAKDVENAIEAETLDPNDASTSVTPGTREKGAWVFTDSALLQAKRDQLVETLSKREGASLIRKTRATYWSQSQSIRAAFTISKRYDRKDGICYWYAYHPQWHEFLEQAERPFLVFGCMDRAEGFAVPISKLSPMLANLYKTEKEGGSSYWHIQLYEDEAGQLSLMLPKQKQSIILTPFILSCVAN